MYKHLYQLTKKMSSICTQQTETDNDECGICYTELDNKNTVVTKCNHMFCTECFFKWLSRKETCALCRYVLLSDAKVEERESELQDIHSELTNNYIYLGVLKKNIKKREDNLKRLVNDSKSIMNRQIRMRHLLEQTRITCDNLLSQSLIIKETIKNQNNSVRMLKEYKKEWINISTFDIKQPIVETEGEDEEHDISNMCEDLDSMVNLERIRARDSMIRMQERDDEIEYGYLSSSSETDIEEYSQGSAVSIPTILPIIGAIIE